MDSGVRRLSWPGFVNARDLGGYETADGRHTGWRSVVRSDTLNRMGADARSAMVEYGIRAVVDLRLPEQAVSNPNPFALPGEHGVAFHSLPFAGPIDSRLPEFGSLEHQYREMVRAFSTVASAIMTALADASGTVLVHCEYGKDRTGLVSALLLDLVGVRRELIAEDYSLSALCLQPLTDQYLSGGPGERSEREADLARFLPRAEVILDTLHELDTQHGGTEGYLVASGVSRAVLQRLRDRLTAPGAHARS